MEDFEQENTSIALNILFLSHNCEEVMLVYKSSYNRRNIQVIFVMINNETNNCYYFAVKNLSELNSLGWLWGKKEVIVNNNNNNNNDNNNNTDSNKNDLEYALDDALNHQTIEKNAERILKLNHYINKHNWKWIDFPTGPKDLVKFEKNNRTIALKVINILHNTKTISVTYR